MARKSLKPSYFVQDIVWPGNALKPSYFVQDIVWPGNSLNLLILSRILYGQEML